MKRNKKFLLVGLGLSLVIAFFLSPLASSLPDGLEKVLGKLLPGGPPEKGASPASAPLPDYVVPGVKNKWVSTALAGLLGTIVVFAVALLMAKALSRKKSSPAGRKSD
jgi:uncharacterized membrane protein